MQYLYHLAYIAMVLLIGTLASVLAYTFRTSDIFILLLTGMLLANLRLLQFNQGLIIIIGLLALIFIVFSTTAKLNFRELKKHFARALILDLVYFFLCITVISLFVFLIFRLEPTIDSFLICILFAVLAYGIDPSIMIPHLKKENRFIEILEIESLICTTIMASLSFLILMGLDSAQFNLLFHAHNHILAFILSIVIGILVALVIGWEVISILKKNYLGDLAHLIVLTSAILVFIGSELFGGSGVLAIATFGILFGNSHVSHLLELEKFESTLAGIIKIMTFMMLGTVIIINPAYILQGTLIFIIYLLIRLASILIAFSKDEPSARQVCYFTLNTPKGVDVAVILLLIVSLYSHIPNIGLVINLSMILIIYSIAVSAIASQFTEKLLGLKNVKKVQRN